MLPLATSFALMLWTGPDMALWVLAAFIIVGRIGLGFILPSLNPGAMRPLDKSPIAQGSSAIRFIRMRGGAVGVGLCGIVLAWRPAVQANHPDITPLQGRIAAFHESFVMLALLCLLDFVAAPQLRSPPGKSAA